MRAALAFVLSVGATAALISAAAHYVPREHVENRMADASLPTVQISQDANKHWNDRMDKIEGGVADLGSHVDSELEAVYESLDEIRSDQRQIKENQKEIMDSVVQLARAMGVAR